MKKINIILLIIWMIIIFLFSQDSGVSSSNKSDTLANDVISFISDITNTDYDKLYSKLDLVIHIIRKSAHFLEYFILGFLAIRVLKDYNALDTRLCVIGILLCFLYACSDEIHQLFVSERSGRISDVFIDTVGASLSIYLYYLFHKFKNRKN